MYARSRRLTIAASVLLVGSLAACSSNSGSGSGGYGQDGAAAGSASSAAASPSASPSGGMANSGQTATVATADTDLGTILVDGKGMTLYLYTKDTQNSGESTCEGQCLATWPPLLGEPSASSGVDASMLGTITRSDGSTQVSYNGWPLYYWANDTAAGQTTGQGVGGVWWVVTPGGEAIM